jgi:hypothetical protein
MTRTLAQVGELVRQRREQRDLTVKEATSLARISDTTWGKVEAGQPVSARSYRAICRALGWSEDSVDLLLQGKQPTQVAILGSASLTLSAQDGTAVNVDPKLIALERRLSHSEELAAESALRLDRIDARLEALEADRLDRIGEGGRRMADDPPPLHAAPELEKHAAKGTPGRPSGQRKGAKRTGGANLPVGPVTDDE